MISDFFHPYRIFYYVCIMQKGINIEDNQLFQAVKEGDKKAFDTLFLRYYPMLCAYAKQFVDLEDGKEIVQDVMVWFWENKEMQTFDTSLKNYLFKSVRNRCLTLTNRNEIKQRIQKKLQVHMEQLYEDPDFYIVEELAGKIETAIMRLPESYREAFELNRFQNMTYNEIAFKLGVSPNTIDYKIQQALKILRHELKEYLPLLASLFTPITPI